MEPSKFALAPVAFGGNDVPEGGSAGAETAAAGLAVVVLAGGGLAGAGLAGAAEAAGARAAGLGGGDGGPFSFSDVDGDEEDGVVTDRLAKEEAGGAVEGTDAAAVDCELAVSAARAFAASAEYAPGLALSRRDITRVEARRAGAAAADPSPFSAPS